ncbi:hypothetical protein ACFQV2_30035 [Actinokineospora soli]|uniref:Uncharacterized protein n=1 Tax=Actinokineospora soli TaxID=1048753 RepID=A0ABW2TX68_9PSEU
MHQVVEVEPARRVLAQQVRVHQRVQLAPRPRRGEVEERRGGLQPDVAAGRHAQQPERAGGRGVQRPVGPGEHRAHRLLVVGE